MAFANVFINIPVKSIADAFTYRVPETLSQIAAGWRVVVPFGGRAIEGFVVSVEEETTLQPAQVKDILAVVDREAWFTPRMLEAAAWLASFYLCARAEMMRLFMPGKSGIKISAQETIQDGKRIKQYIVQQREHAVYDEVATLAKPLDDDTRIAYRKKPAQLRLLEFLQREGNVLLATLRKEKFSASVLRALIDAGLVTTQKFRRLRDSYATRDALECTPSCDLPPLTEAQNAALSRLAAAIARGETQRFLLYGVTGSGKTRVYMEAAMRVRDAGRQVIVLVPEIALTGQLVRTFQTAFAGDIVVLHSRLSVAERNDATVRVRRGEANVIIGARSALFTPADNIGLIIMDEEQDLSYKQDEAPRYHARVVAGALARIHGAVLLLGSATPSMESMHYAQEHPETLLTLPARIGNRPLPTVTCVDMREELRHGNRHVLSHALQQAIRETIAQKQQVILMLNRRGYSTFVMCRACGHVLSCTDCGLPLVYHSDGRLACHHCDMQTHVVDICPKCGSTYIKYFGTGTEKLEQELRTLVPEARVIRLDRDTTQRKFAHSEILDAFRRGDYDILLGTQMVAKGHDIPNVTLVGVLSADASLHIPDCRAAERCFMLITQTAGRAGRGALPGNVIVQGYNPEHYAVLAACSQDYMAFYREELAMRRALFYPPFCRLVKLLFLHAEEAKASAAAQEIAIAFQQAFANDPEEMLIGPAPDAVACLRGTYRRVILIKTANLPAVQRFLREVNLQRRTDVVIDIDPITM